MTHDVRAVPSVNQDLVVGVGLPLYLLGAVGSWGLVFAKGRKTQKSLSYTGLSYKSRQQGLFGAVCSQGWRFTCQTWEG